MEKKEIENLITQCYLNGALNELNTQKMLEGYHPDFAIFFTKGKELEKLPLKEWIEIIESYKKSGDNSGLREFEHEFVHIDITGKAATVTLKLIRNDELVFTDYITLLKFDEGWKIVTKIYHEHIENPWKL